MFSGLRIDSHDNMLVTLARQLFRLWNNTVSSTICTFPHPLRYARSEPSSRRDFYASTVEQLDAYECIGPLATTRTCFTVDVQLEIYEIYLVAPHTPTVGSLINAVNPFSGRSPVIE